MIYFDLHIQIFSCQSSKTQAFGQRHGQTFFQEVLEWL